MAKYYTNTEELKLVADAIREKGGTSAQLTFPNEFVSAISAIPASSSGGSSSKKDVTFYDYDGTIVDSYSASEFASLSALPANPSHEGLVAQGWNWSLANAKTHVAKHGKLNIGQMYVTQSGATEIDIEMHKERLDPILTICVNGTITVDWGDNTTPDIVAGSSLDTRQAVPHTYTSEGNYTISILATGNNKYSFYGSSSYLLLRKNTTGNENRVYASTIKHIRLGNNIEIRNYAFNGCTSLFSITIPDSVATIGDSVFNACYSLSNITIPNSVTSIKGYAFSTCYSLSSINIPYGVTSIADSVFQSCSSLSNITIPDGVTSIGNSVFSACYPLLSITIPDGVTSIGNNVLSNCYSLSSITIPDSVISIGNYAFSSCYGVKEYHILPTTVPTGGTGMFTSIPSDCIIYVPKGHLNDYQTATNWSTYASYMQEEPE